MNEPNYGGVSPVWKVAIEVETELGPLWAERTGHVVTEALRSTGAWDATISGLIRTVLTPGATFVDAGANIGYLSILASREVGPQGRVFAIEPDPVNLEILKANLQRHSCSNVTVLPVAAWDKPAQLNLMRPPDDGAITRVMGGARDGQVVRAAPLDELISGPVDYLKVDTELTDHIVVRGARRLLTENPSMLITVEFHPGERTHTGDSSADVLDVYADLNLRPFTITLPGDGVTPSSYARIANATVGEGDNCLDFAMSRDMPDRLIYQTPLLERAAMKMLGPAGLKRAGDLLEYLPKRVRPKFRHRDREPGPSS
jgi:FkbM family methyltransferase